jgi:N-acetyl-gamma-glutamyl-phosphate reductase
MPESKELKITAGIWGAAGYTAGELIRILLNHPKVTLSHLVSESQAGLPITSIHTDLLGETDLVFAEKFDTWPDVVFLCKGHGASVGFLKEQAIAESTKVIDLSHDFRLSSNPLGFVYGLPELNADKVKKARLIANPGCFATAMELALLPAASAGLLKGEIHISGITGSTGAGQSLSPTSHFTWREGNMSAYKVMEHQHLAEVAETLSFASLAEVPPINFIPYRGNYTRGIITTAYFDYADDEAKLVKQYTDFYKKTPFTHVSSVNPDLKMVVNTNKCVVYPKKVGNKAVVISVIDNLLKGASGQAVQNMNLAMGWEERTGLQLKGVAF